MRKIFLAMAVLLVLIPTAVAEREAAPLVAVVVDSRDFEAPDYDDLERHLEDLSDKKGLDIAFTVNDRYLANNDWDYAVDLKRTSGISFDECGFRRTHYEWKIYSPDEELIGSGHQHKMKRTVQDIFKAVRRDWR